MIWYYDLKSNLTRYTAPHSTPLTLLAISASSLMNILLFPTKFQPSPKLATTISDSIVVSVLNLIPPQRAPLPPPSFTPNSITVTLSSTNLSPIDSLPVLRLTPWTSRPDRFYLATPFYVFSFFIILFCLVPCGRLSWLLVSFWAHVNIAHHIIMPQFYFGCFVFRVLVQYKLNAALRDEHLKGDVLWIYRLGQKNEATIHEASAFDCSRLQNAWTNSHDFCTLQRRFVLNTSVNSNRNKFITQSGAIWRMSETRISLLTTATGTSAYKVLCRTNLDRLLNKTDNSCSCLQQCKVIKKTGIERV